MAYTEHNTAKGRQKAEPTHLCLARRQFLIMGAASVVSLGVVGPRNAMGQVAELVMGAWPRKVVGTVAELESAKAIEFSYPNDDITNLLFMLGEEAGGGVGPDRNIVAFNSQCPHQGAYLDGSLFHSKHSLLGPCPLHLSTFDLTKYGMVASGHATASLPQITLELDGDDIVATGVMGLVYGYSQNPTS
ncbi:hypothetical protein B7H23_00235 [Notoacmeibacter marinus]|uniref:Rieske domain-containing protein n=1 Tax=Notoacmeibacter marinus TaxID=1876515 RepID=A0A231UZQ8_9HYPH|nr:Rieske 2Fe-2S domain-containing protein [Notoacmeibacter marinus]OXT01453.1 hypothetical protein B7H23_00235 [Notoacmeibacter marinus]